MEQQFGLGDLLAGLSADVGKGPVKTDDKTALLCSGCGLNYEDFRKFGRLGCGQCYPSFKEHLSGLLKKIHGSNRHLGKSPLGVSTTVTDAHHAMTATVHTEQEVMTPAPALLASENIEDLKKQLHNAIVAEDFEKAAKLRDKIRKMEH